MLTALEAIGLVSHGNTTIIGDSSDRHDHSAFAPARQGPIDIGFSPRILSGDAGASNLSELSGLCSPWSKLSSQDGLATGNNRVASVSRAPSDMHRSPFTRIITQVGPDGALTHKRIRSKRYGGVHDPKKPVDKQDEGGNNGYNS